MVADPTANQSSVNTLIEKAEACFRNLPPEESREYEKRIASFASKNNNPVGIEALKIIIESDSPVSYEAFFCLCTIYRRNKDFELLRKLLFTHDNFSDHISFNHLVIQYHVHSEALFDYDGLLEMAYSDAKKLNQNAGYLQSFCNAFATICEQCNDEDAASIIDRWYAVALDFINKAIRLDPQYAKFYWTKARIIAFNAEFREANNLIAQAISLEDSSRPDYALTILNYQSSKTRIELMQQKLYFTQKIKSIENQIEMLNKKLNMEGVEEPEKTAAPKIYEGDNPYVFISYAHMDKEIVYDIIASLQCHGVRVWYDSGLRAGDEWPEEIGDHIARASAVVIMLSSNAIGSKFVRKEINFADEEKKKIIPVLLDDCQLTVGIKLQLGIVQIINKNQTDFINKLGRACGKDAGYF